MLTKNKNKIPWCPLKRKKKEKHVSLCVFVYLSWKKLSPNLILPTLKLIILVFLRFCGWNQIKKTALGTETQLSLLWWAKGSGSDDLNTMMRSLQFSPGVGVSWEQDTGLEMRDERDNKWINKRETVQGIKIITCYKLRSKFVQSKSLYRGGKKCFMENQDNISCHP